MFIQNKYTSYYYNIIDRALSRAKPDIYTEKHHIIPKSLGGSNCKLNIAILTAKEHYICHLLLPKMLTGNNKRKMVFALKQLCTQDQSKSKSRYKINSRTYARLKKHFSKASSELHKGKVVSSETREKISKANKGKTLTDEHKQKISKHNKGKTLTNEHKQKISEGQRGRVSGMAGKHHSQETKNKISASNIGKTFNHSEESKQKISDGLKGRPSPMKGKPGSMTGKNHTIDTVAKMKKSAKCRKKVQCKKCENYYSPGNHSRWHGDKCKH